MTDAATLAAYEEGERVFGAAKRVAIVHSRIYDTGNLYGIDGVQGGVQVVVPAWKVRYPTRLADGRRLMCQEFLTFERVQRLHMTVLCPLFGALLSAPVAGER